MGGKNKSKLRLLQKRNNNGGCWNDRYANSPVLYVMATTVIKNNKYVIYGRKAFYLCNCRCFRFKNCEWNLNRRVSCEDVWAISISCIPVSWQYFLTFKSKIKSYNICGCVFIYFTVKRGLKHFAFIEYTFHTKKDFKHRTTRVVFL